MISRLTNIEAKRVPIDNIKGALLAVIAGGALPFAFAPFEFYFLAPLSLAILFWLWRNSTPATAALSGLFFGLGVFASGLYWLFETFHGFASVPAHTALITLILFVLYLSLFPALCGYLAKRLSPNSDLQCFLIIYPSLWTVFEWLRGEWPVDFPWFQVGYAAIDTPVAALAPIGGVFLVSWVTALLAGIICYGLSTDKRRLSIVLISILAIFIALSLLDKKWGKPAGKAIEVAIIQANIPQDKKWDVEYRDDILETYQSTTSAITENQQYDIVIWPETAIPAYREQVEDTFLNDMKALAKLRGFDLLTGISDSNPENLRDYNSALVISDTPSIYHKNRLVPFAEYIPFRSLLAPVFALFGYHKRDFERGQIPPVLDIANTASGISICYEILFGEGIRRSLPRSSWLVNITNDAWFGDTTAPYQHFQMARMRAKESGRMLVRAANTGLSGIIDADGQVLQRSELNQEAVISSTVYPREGSTPWIQYGDKPVLVLLGLVVLGCMGSSWQKARVKSQSQR